MRPRTATALLVIAALTAVACSDDDSGGEESTGSTEAPATDATSPSDTAEDATEDTDAVDSGTDGTGAPDSADGEAAAFDEERCELNREAGTITYLTGFDYAAAASIVDVIVAQEAGYYEDLCLDVEILPSFSTANYPLIAENEAQVASGGSFSEVVAFAEANDADFVVLAVEGRTAIDGLIVKPGVASELGDLEGTTIGVKGKLPASIEAMLLEAGLSEGEDFETVLLDGFDPLAHIAIESIVGFPGWKSNEPGALDRAGVGYELFDPIDSDIPGSFGVIYTNQAFVDEHPTAVEDFVRATMRGLDDAIADPAGASETAVVQIDAGGNPNFLSPEGEAYRWETDAQLIVDTTPEGVGFGVPDPAGLQAELDVYAGIGLFGEAGAPDAQDYLGTGIAASVYDDGVVIWPL